MDKAFWVLKNLFSHWVFSNMHVYFFLITDTMQGILVLGVCLSFVFHEYDTVVFLIVVPLAENIISFLDEMFELNFMDNLLIR